MSEQLLSLAKHLKAVRRDLKEAARLPHQLEFISDINELLKPVSIELTKVTRYLDNIITENQKLLDEATPKLTEEEKKAKVLAAHEQIAALAGRVKVHANMRFIEVSNDVVVYQHQGESLTYYDVCGEIPAGEEGIGEPGYAYLNLNDCRVTVLYNSGSCTIRDKDGKHVVLDYPLCNQFVEAFSERVAKLRWPTPEYIAQLSSIEVNNQRKRLDTYLTKIKIHATMRLEETSNGVSAIDMVKHSMTAYKVSNLPTGTEGIGSDGVVYLNINDFRVVVRPTSLSVNSRSDGSEITLDYRNIRNFNDQLEKLVNELRMPGENHLMKYLPELFSQDGVVSQLLLAAQYAVTVKLGIVENDYDSKNMLNILSSPFPQLPFPNNEGVDSTGKINLYTTNYQVLLVPYASKNSYSHYIDVYHRRGDHQIDFKSDSEATKFIGEFSARVRTLKTKA